MISTVERLSPAQVKIHIEVDAEAFEAAVQQAYLRQRGRINMPGFRRGKAPRKLVESIYGPKTFFQDAIDSLFPDAYGRTVIEHQLNPVDDPQVALDKAEPGQPLEITAKVTVYPDVTVGDLTGISVERMDDTVDDDAVDQEIERVRDQNARVSEVEDRAIQDDDVVTFDYRGTIDGEAFEGGTAEKEQLTIGSGAFVEGFEEQMIGMNPGEERDIDITFPDDYFQEDLRGKKAVFHIKVHSIHTHELPDLDDEFAKDVSEFDTLAEYKADLRAKLEKSAKQRADYQYESDLLDALTECTITEVPDIMIEREARRGLQRQAYQLVGNKPDQVESLVNTFMDREEVMEYHRADAAKRVLIFLAVEALIARENLGYDPDKDQEVYAEALKDAASDENLDEDAFLEKLEQSPRGKESLHQLIARRKMVKYLKGIAEANARLSPAQDDKETSPAQADKETSPAQADEEPSPAQADEEPSPAQADKEPSTEE